MAFSRPVKSEFALMISPASTAVDTKRSSLRSMRYAVGCFPGLGKMLAICGSVGLKSSSLTAGDDGGTFLGISWYQRVS